MNTSISVKNVRNVSFTSLESKKHPQIVFHKWRQCKNASCDQLAPDKCTAFGFWNVTSVTIDKLGVLVYPQNETVDCTHVFGVAFVNVSQLHLHHCNITVVCKKKVLSVCNSVYLSDSQFVRVAFSTIICYQGSFYLMKNKNIEIENDDMILGGIEVYDSAIATISYCNVSLVGKYVGIIYITKSTNISLTGIFVHSRRDGISIKDTDHTRIENATVLQFLNGGTGLHLSDSIDAQVSNITISFFSMGISIRDSKNTSLQDVGLWQNDYGISMRFVVKVNINNVYVSESFYHVFPAFRSKSLSIKNLTAVNWTGNSFSFLLTTDATMQNVTIIPGKEEISQVEYRDCLISLSHNITIQNALFSGSTSYWTTTDITRQRVVLEIYDSQVEMENCSFENYNITPLKLIQTNLTVSWKLNFTNNTAYRGGAIVFIHDNSLSLSENSRVTFVGNGAIDTGGAIYIVTRTFYAISNFLRNDYMICTNCFLNLSDSSSAKQLIFTNNSAGQGGDVVYGGRMGSSCPLDPYNIMDYFSCLSKFL